MTNRAIIGSIYKSRDHILHKYYLVLEKLDYGINTYCLLNIEKNSNFMIYRAEEDLINGFEFIS